MTKLVPLIVQAASLAVLLTPLYGCGDDGGGDGDGSGSSSSGEASSSSSTTVGAEGEGTTGEDSAETTGGSSEGSSGTTAADSSGAGSSESTGAAVDCPAQAELEACEGMEGCVWLGNPQNGECLSGDPSVCAELEMQVCQQHPACDWDNQGDVCEPV